MGSAPYIWSLIPGSNKIITPSWQQIAELHGRLVEPPTQLWSGLANLQVNILLHELCDPEQLPWVCINHNTPWGSAGPQLTYWAAP